MPAFKTSGIFPDDAIAARAIMLWPNDADRRRLYSAADLAATVISAKSPRPVVWEPAQIRALLEAPSWTELKLKVAECTRRAIVAGYILTFMFLMDRIKDRLPPRGAKGASIKKAIFCASSWAKKNAIYGDGKPFLPSISSVEKCWKEYRGVAHFWSAMELNKIAPVAPQRELFFPSHFNDYMRAVAYMQMFGTSFALDNRSGSSPESLLVPASTWLVNVRKYPPQIMLPGEADAFDDAPFVQLLKEYKA